MKNGPFGVVLKDSLARAILQYDFTLRFCALKEHTDYQKRNTTLCVFVGQGKSSADKILMQKRTPKSNMQMKLK